MHGGYGFIGDLVLERAVLIHKSGEVSHSRVGGGRSGVFQNLDAGDVGRRDAGQCAAESTAARERHAIEHDERRGVATIERRIADAERELAVRQRNDFDAGDATAQQLLDTRNALVAELFAGHCGDRPSDVPRRLTPIANRHRIAGLRRRGRLDGTPAAATSGGKRRQRGDDQPE